MAEEGSDGGGLSSRRDFTFLGPRWAQSLLFLVLLISRGFAMWIYPRSASNLDSLSAYCVDN